MQEASGEIFAEAEELPDYVRENIESLNTEALLRQATLVESEARVLMGDVRRQKLEMQTFADQIRQNREKIEFNTQLPHLVATVVELFDDNEDVGEDDVAEAAAHQRATKAAVVKTTTRQSMFLPEIGLVNPEELRPGDMVGVNKDSYLVLSKLPREYDSRVSAMEVEDRPSDTWDDLGGVDEEICEMKEAVLLPMTHAHLFKDVGILPPKGVLLYGVPGTGKTRMARACANATNATFLKLAGSELVRSYVGEGAKMVRDLFDLAREKAPSIVFIDELDSIGSKRFDSDQDADRQVQRTMLELLNQMDGFKQDDNVKVIAATNRIDILDPALLRSGRFDKKIEFKLPTERARETILKIHSKRMNIHNDVEYKQVAVQTEDMNGAQLKAVCVEAAMIALRRNHRQVRHEDFIDGISSVLSKKKHDIDLYV